MGLEWILSNWMEIHILPGVKTNHEQGCFDLLQANDSPKEGKLRFCPPYLANGSPFLVVLGATMIYIRVMEKAMKARPCSRWTRRSENDDDLILVIW